jgi:uncharacterized protein (TIGR03086 family)
MEVNDLHRRAVDQWRDRVAGVGEDQWHLPTPCEEWDVRVLVNHVVGEEMWTVPLVDGATMEEVGDRFDGDLLGPTPYDVASRASEDAVSAVARRLPERPLVHLSFGDTPIEEYVRQLSADHLVHAWDLAAATGQARTLDPGVVDEVASWFAPRETFYREAGIIGPRQEVAGDDLQSRLLAAFGRDPSW